MARARGAVAIEARRGAASSAASEKTYRRCAWVRVRVRVGVGVRVGVRVRARVRVRVRVGGRGSAPCARATRT
eukprot:scaffold50037_cov80-Phaeocystis_antarctica.AAC.2